MAPGSERLKARWAFHLDSHGHFHVSDAVRSGLGLVRTGDDHVRCGGVAQFGVIRVAQTHPHKGVSPVDAFIRMTAGHAAEALLEDTSKLKPTRPPEAESSAISIAGCDSSSSKGMRVQCRAAIESESPLRSRPGVVSSARERKKRY